MEQKWQVPQDTLSLLLGALGELKSHGFDTLLQNLREDLKVVGTSCPQEPSVGGPREGLGSAPGEEWQRQRCGYDALQACERHCEPALVQR